VCAVLVLVASRAGEETEVVKLTGRTSAGQRINIFVREGEVIAAETRPTTWCPRLARSYSFYWVPGDGRITPFKRSGGGFSVRRSVHSRDRRSPSTRVSVLRGELQDDGTEVRGTIWAHGTWGEGPSAIVCTGRATFSARLRE
jgi:hypothetical protein